MPKSLVPAKKRPSQTPRPTRSGSVAGSVAGSAIKKGKLKTRVAAGGSKPGNKPLGKKALGSKIEKTKVKKPVAKKDPKEKKKVVVKKVKVSARKPLPVKGKKKVSPGPKKPEKSDKTEKSNVKKEKDDSSTVKEPVEVVIHVKKPKAKQVPKNESKTGVKSGNVKKPKIPKTSQMKKEILKKLSGKMDEKLESVVNTILEVAVVKKVHSKAKPDESPKEKKKPKEVAKKKAKETKDVKPDPKKTDIKSEMIEEVETPEKEADIVKEPLVASKIEEKAEKSDVKSQVKELNEEDIRKMEIKKEIIDEFIQEEEKQSKAKFERKKMPFLKKPKLKPKDVPKKEVEVKDKDEDGKNKVTSHQEEKKDDSDIKDVSKPSSTSNEGEKSSKKDELVKNKLKAKSTKGKKGSNNDKSDNEEKLPEDKDDDIMDEEQKAKRMKLYGFWTGPKRHRVASLNAIAKVHCLYENESRGAMNEMLDKSVSKGKIDKRKVQRKNYKESESDEKKESDDSVPEIPKRSLRTAPGMRGVGRHYDVETSSSSAPSSSSSEAETEDEKPVRRPPSPKPAVKKQKGVVPKGKPAPKEKKEEKKEKVEETPQEEPVKKVRKRRRRCELMMDLKDMVVRKRMASLNASAMLAATYSVEKKPLKCDDDRRKKSSHSTTTDSTQSSTEVEPESSDEEVILSGSSKKVAVIVNQDTDVTITGLYVNSTTRSTRHCSITGMQYRISSTSHTQTESTAVTTETVIHTTDHVSVSHSSSSSVEAVGSPSGSCKSYTPLGALSSMQPPGNSSPLMRRHPCSTSAFSAPPQYHHHQDMHGYYQPAGPLISHHYHAAASSSTSSLPAVSAPPAVTSKGSPGPEQTSRPGDPPSEPPPPQEYRPPPFASAGYPPPPHNYYSYLQPPYQECYSPYLKYPPHPGFRRNFWPGHGPGPGASSTSGGPMVTSDPYHGPPPGPGGPIEPFPHPVAQPPPQPYYYPHAAPPTCYSHTAPLRAPMFMSDPSYQTCPCPTMSSFPKNVLTGPLTGASKGSVQQQAQNSAQMSQQTTTGLSNSEQQAQQQAVQQQGLSVQAATQPASSIPNVALALSLETNNPHHGPPSPARGSAGMPPPASPALSTARNPPSWSPPNIIEIEPTKETNTRDEIRPAEPSPPPPLTLVAEGPPVLENQVQAAQRRPRPPKRKPSIERQVSPVVVEENTAEPEKPLSVPEPSPEVVPKRRRSVTPVRSKSEPVKQPPISTRGQSKKPADKPLSANPEKKQKLAQAEALKPVTNGIPKSVTNGVAKPAPKIMDGALIKKVNGTLQKPAPLLKNGISKTAKTICPMGVQKMLLNNCSKAQSPTVGLKTAGARNKKENSKVKIIKSEPKRSGKKSSCKELMLLANPTRTHPNGLKWSNGWSWEGEGFKARVFLAGDESPVFRRCYPAMRHSEGDIIYPMDCILLKSGPRKQQLPFIAKVASLWENPEDGEMMISLLWYYRPEHTDQGRQPLQPDDEVFASRHRDTNSVACIEDKCYVLTYNEYCRYKKSLSAADFGVSNDRRRVVPQPDYYPRSRRLPSGRIANELLFFCRKVYDFRTKRLLKKPY